MKKEQKIRLAENLKKLMASKNLTITTTCQKIGMNKSTLHNYCNGVIPRNLTKLQELADLLGVSLNDLILNEEPRASIPSLDTDIDEHFEIKVKRILKKMLTE